MAAEGRSQAVEASSVRELRLDEADVQAQMKKASDTVNAMLGGVYMYNQKPKSISERVLNGIVFAPIHQPFKLVSTLIQLGHEPVEPFKRYNILLRKYLWYYPGIIGYSRSIVHQYGWRALFRGIIPAALEGIVGDIVADQCQPLAISLVNSLPLTEVSSNGDMPDNVDNIRTTRAILVRATKGFLILSISRCLTEIITRPFSVIATRSIAQHVGQESLYSGLRQAVTEIYNNEGIAGFFSGLVPALIEHVTGCLKYEIVIVVIEETVNLVPWEIFKYGLLFIKVPLAAYLARTYNYPLRLVSTLMAVNDARLQGVRVRYSDWKDCLNQLTVAGEEYRGNAILLRRPVPKGNTHF